MSGFLDASKLDAIEKDSSYPEDRVDDFEFERINCYLYKGEQKTWRVGPDPTKCDCWMVSDCEAATYDEFFKEVLNCHDGINWLEYRTVDGEIHPTEFKRFLIKHHYADKYANEYSITHSGASGWKQPLFGFWDRRSSQRVGEPDYLIRRCRMPADRTWCPEGPREPTPEPTPEATPEPTPAPTPELPVKAPLSDNTYVYLYHIGGRWRVGPDYRNRDCWLFTKKTPNTPVSKATEWYRVDDDDNIVRSSFELDQLQESKSNDTYFAEDPENYKKLPRNVADNLYGAYKPHRSKDDIWYHGPIMWKGNQKKQKLADVVDDEMVFVGDRNIVEWKNVHNKGVTGYYDLVQGRCMESTSDMLYVARHTTRPEFQNSFIYRVGQRWVVGPQRAAKKNLCWLYSEENETHVTDPQLKWIENINATERKQHKNIRVYPCGVKQTL